MRLNQAQKKNHAIKRHGKHGMCVAAAGVTWHTVLRQTFYNKNTLSNNDKNNSQYINQ